MLARLIVLCCSLLQLVYGMYAAVQVMVAADASVWMLVLPTLMVLAGISGLIVQSPDVTRRARPLVIGLHGVTLLTGGMAVMLTMTTGDVHDLQALTVASLTICLAMTPTLINALLIRSLPRRRLSAAMA